jgi:hypothetical protein
MLLYLIDIIITLIIIIINILIMIIIIQSTNTVNLMINEQPKILYMVLNYRKLIEGLSLRRAQHVPHRINRAAHIYISNNLNLALLLSRAMLLPIIINSFIHTCLKIIMVFFYALQND